MRVPLQELVRRRLRALVEKADVPLRVLGDRLHLSASGVGRILNDEGYTILLPHVEAMCDFFQISPAELMTEPGALIQPVGPEELQLLTHFRQLTYTQRHGLLAVLEGRAPQPVPAHRRKRARLGHSELTAEQQALVDLYVRSEPQAREGVMQILRGTARSAVDGRRARRADMTE